MPETRDPREGTAADDPTGAVLSDDRRYRYTLWRSWDASLPRVNFVMLNPSTADEVAPDPTITRCVGFARRWGYGGIIVTNLFAYRATDPDEMCRAADPIGPENDRVIAEAAAGAGIVVCAWGAFGGYAKLKRRGYGRRDKDVRSLLLGCGRAPHAIKLTRGGEPGHPLYLKADLEPIPYGDRG